MSSHRPDIDGLRAICIGSVVMFHAGFHDWTGGFIGVDVFFVISGFLITSLISKQVAFGQFSLLAFYERRVRRLLAATIPVILFATLFALSFYSSKDLVTYCKSLVAFIVYGSNWFFLSQTGYFATPPEATPLLHTWSLGVEEQFYLAFPALLLVLLRFPRLLPWVLAVLAGLSLAYAQWEISGGHLDRAFFSSFTRFWELLAGALLALMPAAIDRTAAIALSMRAVGLVAIVASVFLYGPETPFPGVAALLPVGGALFMIAASPDRRDPLWRLLASGPMTYLGRISYSLYLWHWPVLGAMRTLVSKNDDSHIALAIGLSVALAALSYSLVEQPIRTRRKLARGRDMALLLASVSTVTVAVGLAGWSANGWPGRFPPHLEAAVERALQWPKVPAECVRHATPDGRLCLLDPSGKGTVDLLLWGDSHAHVIFPAFQKYAETRGLAIALATRGRCPPLLDTGRENRAQGGIDHGCVAFNNAVHAYIREQDVPAVALAGRWSFYADGHARLTDLKGGANEGTPAQSFTSAIKRTLDGLNGRAVVLVQQVPEQNVRAPNAYFVLSRLGRSLHDVSVDRARHQSRQRATLPAMRRIALRESTLLIDPASELCGASKCIVEAAGRILYSDSHHLNTDGGLFLYPLIARELDGFLAKVMRMRREARKMAD